MGLGFVYWAFVGLAITLIGNVIYGLLPRKYSLLCGRLILQKAFQIFINYLKVTGLLVLDDQDLQQLKTMPGPLIIAPNHIALWDAVYIIARIPEVTCIMKGTILRNPFLGGGAKVAGYIPSDSSVQMLFAATHKLKKGAKLLLFPEGTRTRSDALWINPLQAGIGLMAKYSNAAIIPVYIRSNSRFLEKGRPLFLKPEFPLIISLKVGEPIKFQKMDDVHTFGKKLSDCYIKELSKPHPLRRATH